MTNPPQLPDLYSYLRPATLDKVEAELREECDSPLNRDNPAARAAIMVELAKISDEQNRRLTREMGG